MRRLCVVAVLGLCLKAGQASAVFEDVSSPERNVHMKVDGEAQADSPEALLQAEEARQAAARARVEKIRNLPPEKVQAWTEGRIEEEELERFAVSESAEAAAANAPLAVEIPRSRVIRLELCVGLAVCMAVVWWRRRRQEQLVQQVSEKKRSA